VEGWELEETSRRIRAAALAYLRSHNTASLATCGDDGPWAASVFYVNRGFRLYFLSEPASRHARNVAVHPAISASVNEDYRDWRAIKGIQLEGRCAEVPDGRERALALDAYRRKYPFVVGFLGASGGLEDMQIGDRCLDVRLYRVQPNRLFFLDNARGFSQRAEIALGEAGS
jgi:uncharacterized protein YhbP (UPF0306 family)